jgi:hypothetical protein
MRVEVTDSSLLRFADGSPVRAASGVARHGERWLVVQDDATHGCLWDGHDCSPVRLLPPVEGLDVFDDDSGTKELKPDLEAVVTLPDGSVLVLGSGSTEARMRAVVLAGSAPVVHELRTVYAAITAALAVPGDQLNLEGACVVGDALRWFQRGLPAAGAPTASVDVDLAGLLSGGMPALGRVRRYDLGTVDGVGLAVTDAVTLPDGRVLVSAAAEDSPTTYDDGPVVGSALAVLDDEVVVAMVPLPEVDGHPLKVEGLGLVDQNGDAVELVAVVDADDPRQPSTALRLEVSGLSSP